MLASLISQTPIVLLLFLLLFLLLRLLLLSPLHFSPIATQSGLALLAGISAATQVSPRGCCRFG